MDAREFPRLTARTSPPALPPRPPPPILPSMADPSQKWPENADGRFFVDQECIDCDLCREIAPDYFTRHKKGGYSYVFRQPDSEEGLAQCREALAECPVEAIGEQP